MSTSNLAAKAQAFKKLNIPSTNKTILCLDGGGIRGILTIQLLKQIEAVAGIPCYELFDMVSGTSTGGIISGLIASGKTAREIGRLYMDFVTHVFMKRGFPASRYVDLPAYNKENYRADLETIIKGKTLAQVCKKNQIDLMITAKDITGNEETFFTCFTINNSQQGTYKDSLLKYVMEATMSAPTYFRPYERFVDGGTTAYNNPSLAAMMEAKCYGGKEKYKDADVTLFSLGTGITVKSVSPAQAVEPKGPAVIFWLNYVMQVAGQDASTTQEDILRSGLIQGVDYRRYQISFDTKAIAKLPNMDISTIHDGPANYLDELTEEELNGIAMDDVTKFGLVSLIGQAMAEKIMQENKFTKDFINPDTGRDMLVTAFGDVNTIKAQLSNPEWGGTVPTE